MEKVFVTCVPLLSGRRGELVAMDNRNHGNVDANLQEVRDKRGYIHGRL